jgi:hypothetical protein
VLPRAAWCGEELVGAEKPRSGLRRAAPHTPILPLWGREGTELAKSGSGGTRADQAWALK